MTYCIYFKSDNAIYFDGFSQRIGLINSEDEAEETLEKYAKVLCRIDNSYGEGKVMDFLGEGKFKTLREYEFIFKGGKVKMVKK